MKCPYCGHVEDKVIDSRPSQDSSATRRRRECLGCSKRFTTYEKIEESIPHLIKKDGTREPYNRGKVLAGIEKACEKRPVSTEEIDAVVARIETTLVETGEKEVECSVVGEAVMNELRGLDEVAYVRFASVYREFRDINEFMTEMRELLDNKAKHKVKRKKKK